MALNASAQAELCRLRDNIAQLEGRLADADRLVLDSATQSAETSAAGLRPRERRGRLRLGIAALDAALGGGLALASLHEIRAGESRDGPAAAGFVLALLARLKEAGGMPSVLWISEAGFRRETGELYPPGLLALGLDPARIVEVRAQNRKEALWAFEAGLACKGLGAAICEIGRAALELGATRRCALRARETGVTGFLLRLGSAAEPSAAEARLRPAPAPAGRIGFFPDGIGRMAWRLELEKSRGGRTGHFGLEWNAHERCFVEKRAGRKLANPQPLSAAPLHGSSPPAGAGRAELAGDVRRVS